MRVRKRAWRRLGVRRATAALLVVGAGSAVAGLGASSSATAAGAHIASGITIPSSSSIGTAPIVPPKVCGQEATYTHTAAEQRLLATLPAATRAAYNIWPFPIKPTPWANYKGVKGPWKIGYIDFPLVNAWQVHGLAQTKADFAAAKKKGLVTGSLVTYIQASMATATPEQQIAAVQQMVRQGVNGIILHSLDENAEAAAVDAAGKAGVPIVQPLGIMPTSKYSVNFAAHNFATGPTLAQLAKAGLANKPINALYVRGVTSVAEDQAWDQSGLADLSACKNVTLLGTVVGAWSLPTAKSAILTFLASHPQPIQLVVQDGSMAVAVIQAFQQAGRPVPMIAMNNANAGELSYWDAHKSNYFSAGTTINGDQAHNTAFRILLRILGGDGLKVRDVEVPSPTITPANISSFACPGAGINSDAEACSPLNFYGSNSELNGYFAKPGTPGGI